MTKITLKIDGMMCGMCEAHMNEVVRNEYKVKKVTSSHSNKETVIITENNIDDESLESTVSKTGYELKEIIREPYEKKGFFVKLRRG